MAEPLRLLVYDRTRRDPLSLAWRSGSVLYRGLGRIDATFGATSWVEAFEWLANVNAGRAIAEVQYWGHGKWGEALIGEDRLSIASLERGPLHAPLVQMRERLVGPAALWWWRTCETFGARAGHDFAIAWTRFLGCASAGHTYVIGAWQSGLHSLALGETPTWSPHEGLEAGTPEAPESSLMSHRTAPSTIHFLSRRVPRSAFS
ncbi:MAG: hypothetical protein H0T79_14505 [Deltaproteobacteria bacterium]|nr:hypothetical protein [Deltaproteobacteria bacterium]